MFLHYNSYSYIGVYWTTYTVIRYICHHLRILVRLKSFATLTIFADLQTLINTFPYCSTLTVTVKHCWELGLAVSTSINKQIHTLCW